MFIKKSTKEEDVIYVNFTGTQRVRVSTFTKENDPVCHDLRPPGGKRIIKRDVFCAEFTEEVQIAASKPKADSQPRKTDPKYRSQKHNPYSPDYEEPKAAKAGA